MMRAKSTSMLRDLFSGLAPTMREIAVLSLIVNALALAVPIFILQVYDRVVFHAGISTLQGLALGMGVVIVFDFILRQSRARILQTAAVRVDVDISRRLFTKLMAVPLPVLEQRPASYWQTLFRDVDIVRNAYSGPSALLICDLPFVFLFLGVAYVIAPAVIWVLVAVLPIYVLVALRSGYIVSAASEAERRSVLDRETFLSEIIAGRATAKALCMENAMRPAWEEAQAATIERAVERGAKADTYANIGISLTMLTTVAMTSIGAIAILDQQLTIGALIAANMLSTRLLGTANQLVGNWRTFVATRHSARRLSELFALEEDRQEAAVRFEKSPRQVSLDQVTFAYGDEQEPAVRDMTLDLPEHGIHAVIGPNGSGKSTILKLMMGLYQPAKGRVLLDGADVRQFTRQELSTWIGYVPQECHLFAGSIRDNITQRMPDAKDAEVFEAASEAGAHRLILDLPGGYATQIGEAGRRFSIGQRQRIAIARAILGRPGILCLDEPSSHLDREAELELRTTLAELSKTRAVIVVTHSPILLSACQSIVAIDKGRVTVTGPAEQLLAKLFGTLRQQPIRPAKLSPPVEPVSVTGGATAPARRVQ